MNKKAANLGIVLLVIGLIMLVSVGILFFYGTKEAPELPPPAPEVEIDSLRLCNYIDDDYNCVIKGDNIYSPGNTVYVFFEIENLKPVNGKIDYTEDFEVYDSNGKLIPEATKQNLISEEVDISQLNLPYTIPVRNILPSEKTDPPGEYSIRIIVKDINSGIKTEKSIEFELR